ncbi:predicted protein [Nematostella vectensis]|uniref:Testicular haploid expressed gene protein-like n=1 Tax=Nematostella vectensis TaxID=45351 RepID=A7RUD2_NEMVE|nr:predicted protein [Nematostella vectensis]|eukprot:XP_001637119.1 predicted protein [Nematostella vectensis]
MEKQHNVFKDFTIGRSSPVWVVSRGALQFKGSDRLARLSQPKRLHPLYQPCRSVETVVTPSAKKADCNAHIEVLSEPKRRSEICEREWTIKKSSLKAHASERVLELSHAKGQPHGFIPDNFESWRVSKAAQSSKPSSRVEELAKPIVRQVAYNLPKDDAFSVSKAAQRARCTNRISDLSQPIYRGR